MGVILFFTLFTAALLALSLVVFGVFVVRSRRYKKREQEKEEDPFFDSVDLDYTKGVE